MYKSIDNVHNIVYNIIMKDYRITQTTVSLINYHFVFCPRYRRKIFEIQGVENKFTEIVKDVCKALEIDVISIKFGIDYTHIYLNCLPTLSPSDVMNKIKGESNKVIREEFKELNKMQNLWTRNYLVSTDKNISSEIIKEYVERQRTRY